MPKTVDLSPCLRECLWHPHLVPSKAVAVSSTLFFNGNSVTSPQFPPWYTGELVLDRLSRLWSSLLLFSPYELTGRADVRGQKSPCA